MKIKATIAEKQGAPVQIKDVILDDPKPNEVLIKTVATGICHTDVAGRDMGMTPYPVALGHEGAGIVEQVGSTVQSVKPGDHAVDSIGYGPLITDLLHALGTDGKLYLIGIAGKLDLTGMDIMGESKQVIGLIEGDAIPQLFIPKLIKYFKKGKFPVDRLMKFYPFDQVNQAFDDFTGGKVIKPVITFE